MNVSRLRVSDPRARGARAEHILDVAAQLLRRWGYKRLTMDDIASEARVGKGTVYLHWKTREALFQAVLNREVVTVLGDLLRVVQLDPRNAAPDRLGAIYFEIIMKRPLVRAIFQMDREVLGDLVQREHQFEAHIAYQRVDFMRFLQDLGLVRKDMSAEDLAYAFRTMLLGFFLADPIMSDEQPSLDRKVELLRLLLSSALGVDTDASEDTLAAVADRVLALIEETRASGTRLLAQLMRPRA